MFLVVLLVVAIAAIALSMHHAPAQTLEIPAAAARRHRFSLILDVRTPKERETLGFYPNSIPIPLQDIVKDVPALIGEGAASKQKDILVYANGDRRAHVAAEMLYDAGFTRVKYVSTTYDQMLPPH